MSSIDRVTEVYPRVRTQCGPLGLHVDRLVVALGLGAAPSDDKKAADLEHQARSVFQAMRELVEEAGGGLENIAKATAHVSSVEQREPVNGVWWEEIFPDPMDKPAYKVLVAPLPPGRVIELDVYAVLGATRRRIDLPGVPARDPTVEIGGMVFTSRVHPTLPFADGDVAEGGLRAQARQAFENVLGLLSLAGGKPADIVQLTSFGRTPSYAGPTREVLAEMFPDPATRPRLNTVTNFVPAKFEVMVEMAATIGGTE
jgi:enamine deaminase RidA (YjgF/YER057c/UK114 family)